jgi:hypothetical protein
MPGADRDLAAIRLSVVAAICRFAHASQGQAN